MIEKLIEVWLVMDKRGENIVKAQYLEDKWVPLNELPPDGDTLYVNKAKSYKGPTIRDTKRMKKSGDYPTGYEDRDWHG